MNFWISPEKILLCDVHLFFKNLTTYEAETFTEYITYIFIHSE